MGIGEEDWANVRQVVAEVHPVGDRVVQVCNVLRHQGFHVCKQVLFTSTPRVQWYIMCGLLRSVERLPQ